MFSIVRALCLFQKSNNDNVVSQDHTIQGVKKVLKKKV